MSDKTHTPNSRYRLRAWTSDGYVADGPYAAFSVTWDGQPKRAETDIACAAFEVKRRWDTQPALLAACEWSRDDARTAVSLLDEGDLDGVRAALDSIAGNCGHAIAKARGE